MSSTFPNKTNNFVQWLSEQAEIADATANRSPWTTAGYFQGKRDTYREIAERLASCVVVERKKRQAD